MSDNLPPDFIAKRLWELRTPNDGSRWLGVRKFDTPDELWAAACLYFSWSEANPHLIEKIFCSNGEVVVGTMNRPRAMSINALCLFLKISRDTFHKWSAGTDRDDLIPACTAIREIIYTQKFEGAASDIFNANIIARDLGLRDVKEISGPNGGPVQLINTDMSPQEAAAAYAATLQGLED